jgi:phosphatidate cytidylyltransferase
MIQRIATAVVLIPLVLILVLKAPVYILIIVAGLVALLAIVEFLKLASHYGIQPLSQLTYIFVVFFFVSVIVASTNLTAASVFAFAYIAIPMALLVEIRRQPAGAIWVIYTLLAVWAGDIFAYFVGKSLGRHRMSRRISPKKTWEGAFASLLASLIIGTIWFQHAPQVSAALLRVGLVDRRSGMFGLEQPHLWPIIVLSAAVNIAAQLGDLVESLIKRGAGVKDSGSILPGHGGMLDRIDAMLFAVPVVWAYTAWRIMQ